MQGKLKTPGWLREFLSVEGGARGGYVLVASLAVLLFADLMGMGVALAIGEASRLPVEAALWLLVGPTFVRRMRHNLRSRRWALLPILTFNPAARAIDLSNLVGWLHSAISLSLALGALTGLYMLVVAREARADQLRPTASAAGFRR